MCHIPLITFQNSKLPCQGNTSDCGMYACLVSLFYIIYYAHCNNIAQQAARLLLENVTIEYTANVSSRPFKSISLLGYGGKVSSPNVV